MENGTMTAAETAPPSVTFIKLCLLWTALHKGGEVPAGCRSVLSEEDVMEIRMSPRDGIGNVLDRLDDGSKYYNWWKERHANQEWDRLVSKHFSDLAMHNIILRHIACPSSVRRLETI